MVIKAAATHAMVSAREADARSYRPWRCAMGNDHAFYDAWASRQRPDRSPVEMGEEFDFDDGLEMRRRLPRLSALFLGPEPTGQP
jgi:hypothetical protein